LRGRAVAEHLGKLDLVILAQPTRQTLPRVLQIANHQFALMQRCKVVVRGGPHLLQFLDQNPSPFAVAVAIFDQPGDLVLAFFLASECFGLQ
jgi:hypothetical protein